MKHLTFWMRAATLILLLLCPICQGRAQSENVWLWPIEGQKAGANILLRPQDPLDHEANYCNLIIGAKEGTEVIAPADGVITWQMLGYRSGLYQSRTYGYDDARTFDAMRKKMEEDPDVRDPKKYINGDIGLKLADGREINFCGLRGNRMAGR